MSGNFKGTGTLIRLFLRLDRIALPIWIIVLSTMPLSTASSYMELYSKPGSLQGIADMISGNAALTSMNGPIFAMNIGALTAWKVCAFGSILVGLMSMLTVIKHTRVDEEAGRSDLLGSNVVGRYSALTAVMVVTVGANVIMGLLLVGGLMEAGLALSGSIAMGLSWTFFGILIGAITAVVVQLTEGAGTARGIMGTILGIFFALRVVGDSGGVEGGLVWLSWLSPIGWVLRFRSFAGEQWWITSLFLIGSVISVVAAFALLSRRDVGAGLLPRGAGPTTASPGLRSPLALSWRLHKGSLTGWAIGFIAFGAVMGGAASSAGDVMKSNPQLIELMRKLGGSGGFVDVFFAAMAGISGFMASIYATQAVLKLREEEEEFRADAILTGPIRRSGWVASHLAVSLVGSAVLMILFGLAGGLIYGVTSASSGTELPRILTVSLLQLPAVWVLSGIALALFGILPRLAAVSWGILGFFFLVGQLGDLLGLSPSVMRLSPFSHIPGLPVTGSSLMPLLGVAGVALALIIAGFIGFQRRDVG